MASYIRSWLSSNNPSPTSATPSVIPPTANVDEDEDDNDTVKGVDDDNDEPPAFPSINSAQRIDSKPAVPQILTDSDRMPPPPLPGLASRTPGVMPTSSSNTLAVPPAASSLAVPPATTKAPSKAAKRQKVALAPGHGPLDWANLKKSGADLRGVDGLIKVTPSMLRLHNKRDDAWSAFSGKVYNITAYLPYHPGGEKELMRVAGRDGSKLFALTHSWVNLDYMLDGCMVGFLVPES
ncbi:cytochrome b5-like heme/steroid binding domain-containing protein [Irpex rosettiformis]|uniref:Cytochrome b5-like heme/steroid binding domain-containing protein n=1 Tax=Irpex rosettiformis TaxID=378272 RepID=A0ACB8UAK6_9APHY|nr:cytochrome b5-like heme/steroid binding domain-containing protein [Irpex rosettiformis]